MNQDSNENPHPYILGWGLFWVMNFLINNGDRERTSQHLVFLGVWNFNLQLMIGNYKLFSLFICKSYNDLKIIILK